MKKSEIEGVFHSSREKLTVPVSYGCIISEVWASKGRNGLVEILLLIGRPLYQREANAVMQVC